MDDRELLDRFAIDASQEAFAQLVRRHADLVYSSARRQLGDAHLAEDATQAVFVLLASKARKIKSFPAGWLISATYFVCRNARKLSARRRFHERRAAAMRPESSRDPQPQWETYAPALDQAMAHLRPEDLDPVVLRYLRGLSMSEVGAVLGLSANTAQKRVERGIQKLREAMSRLAAVPDTQILAEQLQSRAVTPAPEELVQSIVAGAGASKALFTTALARHAGRAMVWTKLKIAAAILLGAAVAGGGGVLAQQIVHDNSRAAVPPPATAPAPVILAAATTMPDSSTKLETPKTNDVRLVEWDAMLRQPVADVINKIGKPIDTASRGYQALQCNAFELRSAVADAIMSGTYVGSGPVTLADSLSVPSYSDHRFDFNAQDNADGLALMTIGVGGRMGGVSEGPGQAVSAKLTDTGKVSLNINRQFRLRLRTANSPQFDRTIAATAQLSAGDAIAFLGEMRVGNATYEHLIVFEAFKATQPQMTFISNQGETKLWCTGGPEQQLQLADNALLWISGATHLSEEVAPDYERKLSDGKTVRVLGVNWPQKYSWCTWDAQGNPVDIRQNERIFNSGLQALVQLIGPAEEEKILRFWLPEANSYYQPRYEKEGWAPIDPATGRIDVVVLTGDWKTVASFKPSESFTLDGVSCQLDINANARNNQLNIKISPDHPIPNNQILVAVGQNGDVEAIGETPEMAVFSNPPGSWDVQNWGFGNAIPPDNVDHFELRERTREQVSFDGLALVPKPAPPATATDADVAAVQGKLDDLARKEIVGEFDVRRKIWDQIPPDPKTAKGASRLLVEAIQRGDEPAARKLLIGDDQMVQWDVHFWVDKAKLYSALSQRIGEAGIAKSVNTDQREYISDIAESSLGGGWQTASNGEVTWNDWTIRAGPDGHYRVDPSVKNMQPASFVMEYKFRCPRFERLTELLNSDSGKKMGMDEIIGRVRAVTTDHDYP